MLIRPTSLNQPSLPTPTAPIAPSDTPASTLSSPGYLTRLDRGKHILNRGKHILKRSFSQGHRRSVTTGPPVGLPSESLKKVIQVTHCGIRPYAPTTLPPHPLAVVYT